MNNSVPVSVEHFLQESKIPLRLSCVMESGWPAVLLLWYLFDEGSLFCAIPETARVVSYCARNHVVLLG